MPRVAVSALWKRLAQGHIDPCYLFFGEETYLIQEYTALLCDHVLGSAPRDFNCDVLNLEQASLAEALSVAYTLPMLAERRVVVLQGLQQLRKTDWPPLERYLAQPSVSTVLIGSSATGDTKKLPPSVWQHTVAVECARLEGAKLQAWITDGLVKRGYRMHSEALQTLLHDQQPDLQTITQEIEKLCTYVGDSKTITLDDVHAVTQTSRIQSIFALSDALGRRHLGQALTLIEHLLNQGEPPLVVLSMIIRHVRLLWSVQQLRALHQDIPRLAKTLAVPGAVCRQLVAQSRQFSVEQLRKFYAATLEADLTFKTSNKPPRAILEGLILLVCVPVSRAG